MIFKNLVIDAMVDSPLLFSVFIAGTIILILIVTLLLSMPIKKITVVSLMEE